MTEPTHEVNVSQVLQILGEAYVELKVQREIIAQLQAQVAKLTPKLKKPKVVPAEAAK